MLGDEKDFLFLFQRGSIHILNIRRKNKQMRNRKCSQLLKIGFFTSFLIVLCVCVFIGFFLSLFPLFVYIEFFKNDKQQYRVRSQCKKTKTSLIPAKHKITVGYALVLN